MKPYPAFPVFVAGRSSWSRAAVRPPCARLHDASLPFRTETGPKGFYHWYVLLIQPGALSDQLGKFIILVYVSLAITQILVKGSRKTGYRKVHCLETQVSRPCRKRDFAGTISRYRRLLSYQHALPSDNYIRAVQKHVSGRSCCEAQRCSQTIMEGIRGLRRRLFGTGTFATDSSRSCTCSDSLCHTHALLDSLQTARETVSREML
jgi:hypothetical protein